MTAINGGRRRSHGIDKVRSGGSMSQLIAEIKTELEQHYQADAWDSCIDRWLVYERRRVNHGYGNYDDWRDEEVDDRAR